MRAPIVVGIVATLHVVGITALVCIQGCVTTRAPSVSSVDVDPPPAPVMPPSARTTPQTSIQPGAIPPAPAAGPLAAPEGRTVAVSKGDTLSHIAKRHGVSTRELAEHNRLPNPNSLRIGQKIVIPPHATLSTGKATARSAASSRPAGRADGNYVIQAGDTLSGIAKRYGTKVATLMADNGLTSSHIMVGQRLKVTGAAPAATTTTLTAPAASATEVTVPDPFVGGGDMSSLADELDVTSLDVSDLAIEDIEVPSTPSGVGVTAFEPPQLAPEAASVPDAQDNPIPYTVVEGDTIEEIAKLFIVSKQEIMSLNNLRTNADLKPGQTIKIPPSAL